MDPARDPGFASAHAATLLRALGLAGAPGVAADHPALAWRRAGLMAVTGRAAGPALVAPVALTALADGALGALRAIAPDASFPGDSLPINGALLLGERARLLGLARRGQTSANGSCHLIAAKGGHIALNLPRPDDLDLLPALLGEEVADLAAFMAIARGRPVDDLLERGRLLGLAIAANRTASAPDLPFTITRHGPARARKGKPLVVDLSALWAGPLAGSLLAAAGAEVIKVESRRRPDGARRGHAGFYDWLNAGKRAVALDFAAPEDVRRLRALIAVADIVIEGSRPRALADLGIDAAATAARGATWVSITAHGREGAAAGWTGFGDDAAIAGGLGAAMASGWGEVLFAGDAIADPLAGLHAALCAWAGWTLGGGSLFSVPLARGIAHACAAASVGPADLSAWQRLAEADTAPLYPMRRPAPPARALGADNDRLAALTSG
ncbi:CoA transferase [Novosphingobium bradum]|uniref:CoA transferase n=1 Tax=Novosphingobium bradum TaxID=1737444 RepID=A0ABV7IM42_9SPHN